MMLPVSQQFVFKFEFFKQNFIAGVRSHCGENPTGPAERIYHATLVDRAMQGTPMYAVTFRLKCFIQY